MGGKELKEYGVSSLVHNISSLVHNVSSLVHNISSLRIILPLVREV